MRARNIKPGFFKNEELAEIEPLGRILFEGLWCAADREGRLEDRPKKIKAEILPYDNCDIELLLNALQYHGFIIRYVVAGVGYIAIPKFKAHQNPHKKEPESIIPPVPEQHEISIGNSGTSLGKENSGIGNSGIDPADSLIPDSGFSDSFIPGSTTIQRDHSKMSLVQENYFQKQVVVVEKTPEQKLDDLRQRLLCKPFADAFEVQAIDKMLALLPVADIEIIIIKAHKEYKPKYQGDKIRTFSYFLPIVESVAATIKTRAAPIPKKEVVNKPLEIEPIDNTDLINEIMNSMPEWMQKEVINSG